MAGHGGLLLLAGEAGVGKTRLAEAAIARRARGAARRGDPARRRAVRAGDRRASGPPAGRARGLREPGAARRPSQRSPSGAGRAPGSPGRERLFEALRLAFESVARRSPAVVFLDDLHWADAATLELLPSLAAAAEEWPLLLLGAYRSEDIPRGHPLRQLRIDLRRGRRLEELVVEPLDEAATAELAAQALGADPAPALRAALYDRTQGVPFLVEELAGGPEGSRSSLPRPRARARGSAAVPLPETIRDLVRLRAKGLSARAGRRSRRLPSSACASSSTCLRHSSGRPACARCSSTGS